jgi:hypothetical protein
VPGYAGINKVGTELIITPKRGDPDKFILGIIREDGVHISSYPINSARLKRIAIEDKFWVLKDRYF